MSPLQEGKIKLAGTKPLITPTQFLAVDPDDMDEVYLRATTADPSGAIWHLRYNAALTGSKKWEAIGAPPLSAYVDANDPFTTNGAWGNITGGPSLTVPTVGDYEVYIGATIRSAKPAQIDYSTRVGLSIAGADPVLPAFAVMEGSGRTFAAVTVEVAIVAGGRALKMMYWRDNATPANQAEFARRVIRVVPRRLAQAQ